MSHVFSTYVFSPIYLQAATLLCCMVQPIPSCSNSNNILVVDNFQRVFTIEELYDKIEEVKRNDVWLKQIQQDFVDKIPTEQEYYQEFDKKLTREIYAV